MTVARIALDVTAAQYLDQGIADNFEAFGDTGNPDFRIRKAVSASIEERSWLLLSQMRKSADRRVGITLMMVANAALILLLRQQIRGRTLRPATALNF